MEDKKRLDAGQYTVKVGDQTGQFTIGESTTLRGEVNPPLGEAKIIIYTSLDEGSGSTLYTATTLSDGSYSFSWTPSDAGHYDVVAHLVDGDVTLATSPGAQVDVQSSRCLIATATYGSELSPKVQFLRGFRDNYVMTTYAGQSFMQLFNEVYYSFSPAVASYISGNSPLRSAMRIVLYPLIDALKIGYFASTAFTPIPEASVVVAGVVSSGLLGLFYLAPLLVVIQSISRRRICPEKTWFYAASLWIGARAKAVGFLGNGS